MRVLSSAFRCHGGVETRASKFVSSSRVRRRLQALLRRRLRAPRLSFAVMLRRRLRALRLGFAVMLRRGFRDSRLDIVVMLRREFRASRLDIASMIFISLTSKVWALHLMTCLQ